MSKRKVNRLSRRYASALRKHLRQGAQASLRLARELGQQAVGIGLETLDVARIHEQALAILKISNSRNGVLKRAEGFFTESVSAIEKTHRAALSADVHLKRMKKMLTRRTVELAASNRSLEHGIAQRQSAEKALGKSGRRSRTLLKESLALQKHLRSLTHQIITTQENKRRKNGRDLQDEIAQTLLGINVRLLTLRKEADANVKSFKRDVASTRRLVDRSLKSIKRFAREFDKHHEG